MVARVEYGAETEIDGEQQNGPDIVIGPLTINGIRLAGDSPMNTG